ncbi:hypothetical protein K4L04_18995 (plasmid) [Phaeobacter inhibens]|uniref:calcium-binding protein n=1 Tax=Phaeobacter inhibens TaxID=221822 RepID=UPI0021A3700A|nr:calcium-binding protein [Phaeobacter inhibens]UWR78262.1 hypothetical protein K4L04_18995 [Phaeobacter inhibens]
MTEISNSQQSPTLDDLQQRLTSEVMSSDALEALVAETTASDPDDFKSYAQALDPSLDEQSDYQGLGFSVGASYTFLRAGGNLAVTASTSLPSPIGKGIAGFKAYTALGSGAVTSHFIQGGVARLKGDDVSATDKAAAAFDIIAAASFSANGPFGLAPFVGAGQSEYNKIAHQLTESIIDQTFGFRSKFGTDTDFMSSVNKHITYMEGRVQSLSSAQQSAFNSLKESASKLNELDAELQSRLVELETSQAEIRQATEKNVFDKYSDGPTYTATEEALKNAQKTLKGENGAPDLATLRDEYAAATSKFNRDYKAYSGSVDGIKNNGNFDDLLDSLGSNATFKTAASRAGTPLNNLDFSDLDFDFDPGKALNVDKPGAITSTTGVVQGAANVIGGLAWMSSAAIDLNDLLKKGDASTSEKAVAGLYVASAAATAIGGALDIMSNLAKIAKFSKAWGVAGAVVGAVADLAFGAARVVQTFNDPNASDLQKGLAIGNLLTPGFDLLAIEKAEHYRDMLSDPNLSEADKFAFKALYKQAIFNSIPIFNMFSFAWGDDWLAKQVAGDLIAEYGDVAGDPSVLDDGDIFAFLQNAYQEVLEGFFEEKKATLLSTIEDLGPEAQQLVYVGKTANYSMLTQDPDAKKIYDKVVPIAIREDADLISKFTLTKIDGANDEELTTVGQTGVKTGEITSDGEEIWRENGVDWRLGKSENQPDSITANTAIVAIDNDYAGDAYLYDDKGIDNTVFYQSTGDRDYGYWLDPREVTETRYREVRVPSDSRFGTKTVTEAYEVRVTRNFREYIEGPDGERNNIDHINLGLGRDNVVAGNVDETLRITSGDWQDFTTLDASSGGDADLDRLTLTDSSLKRFEIGNASLVETRHPSAGGDRRVDLTWVNQEATEAFEKTVSDENTKLDGLKAELSSIWAQTYNPDWGLGGGFLGVGGTSYSQWSSARAARAAQKQTEINAQQNVVESAQQALTDYLAGEAHEATLEDVEMLVLTKDNNSRAILYSEEDDNFTLAMTGGGSLPLYLSDAADAKTYETGSINGSDAADLVDLHNAGRVASFAANLKDGDDTLRIHDPDQGRYSFVGGAGQDELQVRISDSQKAAIFLGENAGSHLQAYLNGLEQAVEEGAATAAEADLAAFSAEGVETIGVESNAAAYFRVGGGAGQIELNGTKQADVYDIQLDNDKATDLTIDDATGPADHVQIDLTNVSDFRLEQEYSDTPETASRTILTEGAVANSVELASNAEVTLKLGDFKELTYARGNIFGERVAPEGGSLPLSGLDEAQAGGGGDDLFIVHGDGDPDLAQMNIYGHQGNDQVLLTGIYDVDSLSAMSFDGLSGDASNNLLSFSGATDIRDYHNSLQKFYFLNDHFELDRSQIDTLVRDGAGSSQRDLVVLTSPGEYQGNGGADVFFVGPVTGGNRDFRIKDFSADDTLFFSAQIDFAALQPMRDGEDLIITSPFATDLTRTVVVEDYFADAANQGTVQVGEVELTSETINLSVNTGRLAAMSDQESTQEAGADTSVTADVDGIFTALLNKEWTQRGSGNDDEEFFGTRGADHIDGGVGRDTVHAGAGNDIVNAGSNSEGGSGYDFVSYHILSGHRTALAGSQYIDLRGSQTYRETPYGSSTANVINNVSGFEGVIGAHGHDTIFGDDKANIIYGVRGSDSIDGNGGDDIIHPGQMYSVWDRYSYDILDGGEGFDIVSFEGESDEKISIDIATQSVGWNPRTHEPHTQVYSAHHLYNTDQYNARIQVRNFEGVIGGNHDDVISGDSVANYLSGASGNDRLSGRAGADTLVGGAGNDTLIGGQGSDALFGGAGADTFTIGGTEEAGAQDTIYDFDAAEDTLDISGTEFTVTMEADQFVFDPVSKTQSFFANSALISNGESSVLLHGVSAAEAEQALSGKGAVTLELDDSGGTFTGSAAANGIAGGAGDDHILGMGGNDTIRVSSGSDTLDGGEGFDLLDFSSFESTSVHGIQYGFSSEKFDVVRDNRWVNEGDVVQNFEGVIGSDYRDNFLGASDAVYLDGRGGDDRLIGSQGNDTILGGADNDNIRGGNGDDLLTGGAGRDAFQYGGSDGGMDTITDFDVAEDHFYLFFTEPNSFADVTVTDTQNGVRVEWDTDSTGLTSTGAVLQGVDSSQISADQFLFV